MGREPGLGKAAALQLAREGVEVTLLARSGSALQDARQDIYQQTGNRPAAVVADITTEAGRQAALEACPRPDILINNASGPTPGISATGSANTGWRRSTA